MYETVKMREMMRRLKDKHRTFVGRVCKKLKERGFTTEEISDITGLKESAIRSVMFEKETEKSNETEAAE